MKQLVVCVSFLFLLTIVVVLNPIAFQKYSTFSDSNKIPNYQDSGRVNLVSDLIASVPYSGELNSQPLVKPS